MEKENQNYLEDLKLYQYADVAGRLASDKKTAIFAKGALEKLLEQMDPKSRNLADSFVEAAFASEEGNKIAISKNMEKYQNALNNLTVSEFYDVRKGLLKKSEEYKEVFEKYQGQTVGSIMKKYEQSQKIVNDKDDLFDEKRKEEAKKTIEKLERIYNVISLLEQKNYFGLIKGATEGTFDKLIGGLLKKN